MPGWKVILIDGCAWEGYADDEDQAVLNAGDFFGQDVAHIVRDVELTEA